ncbi:hypothetical protein LCGC14_0458460 [marine sediment metagenome]|uniref:HNH nuclease domain-containing protein n=1 Tax=marine sediment metagenome TaxID=412755 RepID=A0A0F9SYJ2_9ZZZZ
MKRVRKLVFKRAKYKCESCDGEGELHPHHKTYEHRGEEHLYLDDIIVLCKKDHEKFHDIEGDQ